MRFFTKLVLIFKLFSKKSSVKPIILFFTLIFTFTFSSISVATKDIQNENLADVVDVVNTVEGVNATNIADAIILVNALKKVKTFTANFVQVVETSKREKPLVSKGFMHTKKPNLFRWEVTSPSESLIVINKNKLWNFDKDLEQVTIQTIEQDSTTNSTFFLSEDVSSLQKDYAIRKLNCKKQKLKNSASCFQLIPKNESAPFQHMLLGFNNDILMELVMYDQLGQTTTITFLNPKVNTQISDNMFTLKIPKGVDVVNNGN